ncbi:MAG: hypothetical protein R3345_04055 [Fulvivirga sp.]|nr:hypothetical protein [Fulvivirga sp.]
MKFPLCGIFFCFCLANASFSQIYSTALAIYEGEEKRIILLSKVNEVEIWEKDYDLSDQSELKKDFEAQYLYYIREICGYETDIIFEEFIVSDNKAEVVKIYKTLQHKYRNTNSKLERVKRFTFIAGAMREDFYYPKKTFHFAYAKNEQTKMAYISSVSSVEFIESYVYSAYNLAIAKEMKRQYLNFLESELALDSLSFEGYKMDDSKKKVKQYWKDTKDKLKNQGYTVKIVEGFTYD